MGNYASIISRGLCRRCMNEKYGTELLPDDCKYFTFPSVCPECKKMRNIVTYIRPTKRWKLWLKKENKLTPTEM